MNCNYTERTIHYFNVTWYEAISILADKYCPFKCCLNECDKTEYVLEYVYKEHIHYIRYIDGMPLAWAPHLTQNNIPLLDHSTGLFISAELNKPLTNLKLLKDVPVIYPDYSSVDVGVGKTWPAKVFSPFVDSTAWPPYSLVDNYNITKAPYFNLGFIVSKSPTVCEPTWGTYYTADAGPLNSQIKAIRALGGDVTISFGGAANVPIHIVAPDVNSLYEQYKRFTIAYGMTRIDFDLEGTWIDPSYDSANKRNSDALKLLQDYYKSQNKNISIWFTLPVLPTGLTSTGLNVLQIALNSGVEIGGVNVMTMDYGDYAAPNPQGKMGMYGIQAITALHDQLNTLYGGSKTSAQLWAMIGTTPMIGVNDVQSEIFTIQDATQTLQFAQANNIGMISMWSSNRDVSGGSGIVQTNNQFALTFAPYNL